MMMVMMMSSPTELSTRGDTLMVYLEWRHPAGAHPISSGNPPMSSTVHVILRRYSNVPWSDCDPLSWLRTKTVSLVKDKMFRLSSGFIPRRYIKGRSKLTRTKQNYFIQHLRTLFHQMLQLQLSLSNEMTDQLL